MHCATLSMGLIGLPPMQAMQASSTVDKGQRDGWDNSPK